VAFLYAGSGSNAWLKPCREDVPEPVHAVGATTITGIPIVLTSYCFSAIFCAYSLHSSIPAHSTYVPSGQQPVIPLGAGRIQRLVPWLPEFTFVRDKT
jgi:hypothetical protein